MNYENIKVEFIEKTAVVHFIRPKALNALNSRFFTEMEHFLDETAKNKKIRVLILTGEGKAFVAGADITEMAKMNATEAEKFSETGQRVFNKIQNLYCPVIAAVNGFALGGGCELAMACDFRIASSLAKFGQPEVNLGLIPGYAATQRLSRLTNLGTALFLLCTGEMIKANEALIYGLVQKVVEPKTLMETCLKIAAKITQKAPKAVEKVKEVTTKGVFMDFSAACEMESKEFGLRFETDEAKEGITAFLEKRQAKWE